MVYYPLKLLYLLFLFYLLFLKVLVCSRLGVSASGAVGIVFPLMAIIQAIGFTLGMGGGSNISAKLGVKNH